MFSDTNCIKPMESCLAKTVLIRFCWDVASANSTVPWNRRFLERMRAGADALQKYFAAFNILATGRRNSGWEYLEQFLVPSGTWSDEDLQAEILGPIGVVNPTLNLQNREVLWKQTTGIFADFFQEAVVYALWNRSQKSDNVLTDIQLLETATESFLEGNTSDSFSAGSLVKASVNHWMRMPIVDKARQKDPGVAQLHEALAKSLRTDVQVRMVNPDSPSNQS